MTFILFAGEKSGETLKASPDKLGYYPEKIKVYSFSFLFLFTSAAPERVSITAITAITS